MSVRTVLEDHGLVPMRLRRRGLRCAAQWWRQAREQLALAIAPWLEIPEPPSVLDLRGGPSITEQAAKAMGGTWMLEMLERGRPVADHVTILYAGPEGLGPHGDGYRATHVLRREIPLPYRAQGDLPRPRRRACRRRPEAIRVKLNEYRQLRVAVIKAGYEEEIRWAQTVKAPESPEALWREYAWVVINSGMRNQVAEKIWAKVRPWVEAGGRAGEVFGHKAKAEAIDRCWQRRIGAFVELDRVLSQGDAAVVEWCGELPWIGETTKWHLAKNFGADVAKPDRWLERVADVAGETVAELCARLAGESGDRIATVDLVIWRACNLGLWTDIPADDPRHDEVEGRTPIEDWNSP